MRYSGQVDNLWYLLKGAVPILNTALQMIDTEFEYCRVHKLDSQSDVRLYGVELRVCAGGPPIELDSLLHIS
jgi:hypothetical protein